MFDVIVVGGGPAGLQTALTLGRARRSALVLNAGPGRNAQSSGMHNFLSRDGTSPAEFRKIGRQELSVYPSIEVREVEASTVRGQSNDFTVNLADGTEQSARRLVLATGVIDEPPGIEGLAPLWGRSVLHCPYCDGWELRDKPLAVLAMRPYDAHFAVHLTRWSKDVVLCLNGKGELAEDQWNLLRGAGVEVREEPIVRLEGNGSQLEYLVFNAGPPLASRALFLKAPTRQRSGLARQLCCRILDDDSVEVNDFAQTSVAGVYAVGDMARRLSMPAPASQVMLAASQGIAAAVTIDTELVYG
ncbi:MAG: NAD(P)/FAD-dependent oxidoreductase, partial [Candidatus Dormibacteraceae bacterium]